MVVLMRRSSCLAAMFAVLSTVCPVHADGGDGWRESYEAAVEAAEATGQPLLIHFHAWYCGPCKVMESQVFSRADVQRQLTDGLVSVEVDTTRRPAVAKRYGANSIPRDVVVFPDGTIETLHVGAMSHSAYMSMLRTVASRGKQMRPAEGADLIAGSGSNSTGDAGSRVAGSGDGATPVGLEGYCPVRLHKGRVWQKGDASVKESYRGMVYHFSGEQERAEFLKSPADFAPQNLGCDPVVLLSTQQAVTGKIKFGAFFEDRLYLFESAENKAEFKSDPRRYSRIQHAVKPADLAGQRYH
jgi:YHS domain-containing protein